MTHRTPQALAAVTLALCATAAHPDASADARLSDLRIELFAIGTTAPSVAFTSTDGSLVQLFASSSSPPLSFEQSVAGAATMSPVESSCPMGANVACHGRIAGDPFAGDAGASASASAFAGDAFSAQVEAATFLADGTNYSSFVLSPDTVMVITAVSDLFASTDGSGLDDASASAFLQLDGSDGDSSQTSTASALALSNGPSGGRDARHSLLAVSFVNAFGHAIGGAFFAGIDATAVSVVPEPASAWLLVAGVLALAAARRRGRPPGFRGSRAAPRVFPWTGAREPAARRPR